MQHEIQSFHKDNIKLKEEVIGAFQEIVDKSLKRQKGTLQDQDMLIELDSFFNKYGQGVNTGTYFLGGQYKNILDYTFHAKKTASQVNQILRKSTKLSVQGQVAFNYGKGSVGAGYKHENQTAQQKAQAQKELQESKSYKVINSYYTDPLNSISNYKQWVEVLEMYGHYWKLLKIEEPSKVPMVQLLKNSLNSKKTGSKFLQEKTRILNLIDKNCIVEKFRFKIDTKHFNCSQFSIYQKNLSKNNQYGFRSITGVEAFQKRKRCSIQAISIGILTDTCRYNSRQYSKQSQAMSYNFSDEGSINYIDDNNEKKKIQSPIKYEIGQNFRMVVDLVDYNVQFYIERNCLAKIKIPNRIVNKEIYPYFEMFHDDTIDLGQTLLS